MGFSDSAILVFGVGGQIASALRDLIPQATFISQSECNFAEPKSVVPLLDAKRPKLIINCAAFTQVDLAETDFESAQKINADSPAEIAKWCARHESSLIHFSTDYVYSGKGDQFRDETEPPAPINRYGMSKWLGDRAIIASGCHHIILRTSWVFSPVGKNFLKTMLSIGQQKEELNIVSDQIGSPSYAPHLAEAAIAIARHPDFKRHCGVFHCVNEGTTSWFDFARFIFSTAEEMQLPVRVKRVNPILSSDFISAAQRPLNSRLDTKKLERTFSISLPAWKQAVVECLTQLKSQDF